MTSLTKLLTIGSLATTFTLASAGYSYSQTEKETKRLYELNFSNQEKYTKKDSLENTQQIYKDFVGIVKEYLDRKEMLKEWNLILKTYKRMLKDYEIHNK